MSICEILRSKLVYPTRSEPIADTERTCDGSTPEQAPLSARTCIGLPVGIRPGTRKHLDEPISWQDSKDRNMRHLKLIISYDGSGFSGWQRQPDRVTVQGTLASAIGRITGEKVLPQGSGRTDAGVHALAQVVTFATESSVSTANFVKALNDILPASVRVLEVEEAAADFHARKSA